MKDFTLTVTGKHLEKALEIRKADPYFFQSYLSSNCVIAQAAKEHFGQDEMISMGISALFCGKNLYACPQATRITAVAINDKNKDQLLALLPLTLEFTYIPKEKDNITDKYSKYLQ